MNDLMKNVRIVEVYSDVAGYKKGASLGIDALRASSKELNAEYYENCNLTVSKMTIFMKKNRHLNMQNMLM